MNSLMYNANYGSCGLGGATEPAMHIVNSLGLPKKDPIQSSSSNGFVRAPYPSITNSSTMADRLLGSNGHRPNLDLLDSLKYNTVYTPKTYHTVRAMGLGSIAPGKCSYGVTDPVASGGPLHNYSQMNHSTNKPGYVDPDENNNFIRNRRLAPQSGGQACNCDQAVPDAERINQLAQPKRLPCEYQEDRSVFWMSRRVRPNCGNHTHFETTPRLDELALPKCIRVDCDCCSQCMERETRVIDWTRLATPKIRYPQNNRPLTHVCKAALKARCSKRMAKLATPFPRNTSKKINKEQ